MTPIPPLIPPFLRRPFTSLARGLPSCGREAQCTESGKARERRSFHGSPSSPTFPFSQLPACGLIVLAFLLVLAVSALAVDVQTLPNDTAARHGFTHAAKITYQDLDNTDNACTILRLGLIPTNAYVDRVAYSITTPFTNSTIASSNLLLCVGVGGATNTFFTTNQIDGSTTMVLAGKTVWSLSTNMVTPYKSTTSTNTMQATISAAASDVDGYVRGEIRIYWRVVDPGRIDF